MTNKGIFLCALLASLIAIAYAVSGKPHEFGDHECVICHVDHQKNPEHIISDITRSCESCHKNLEETRSHPTDVYPSSAVPEDMPLTDGRITCITCHYVHPDEKRAFIKKDYFLRRPYRGALFCSTCHLIDEKKHIVFEKVHVGTYTETNRKIRIDNESLACIECHAMYINEPRADVGSGVWRHASTDAFPHPIGISYEQMSAKKMKDFRPAGMLNKKIKLFKGNIGCGTCHNVYSKEKSMLVLNNRGSALCRECHTK